jgi:hypothetical protein
VLAEIDLEGLAADRLDGSSDPIEIDAVLPTLARIEHQRQPKGGKFGGACRRRAAGLDVADQLRIPSLITKARRVG